MVQPKPKKDGAPFALVMCRRFSLGTVLFVLCVLYFLDSAIESIRDAIVISAVLRMPPGPEKDACAIAFIENKKAG